MKYNSNLIISIFEECYLTTGILVYPPNGVQFKGLAIARSVGYISRITL